MVLLNLWMYEVSERICGSIGHVSILIASFAIDRIPYPPKDFGLAAWKFSSNGITVMS